MSTLEASPVPGLSRGGGGVTNLEGLFEILDINYFGEAVIAM